MDYNNKPITWGDNNAELPAFLEKLEINIEDEAEFTDLIEDDIVSLPNGKICGADPLTLILYLDKHKYDEHVEPHTFKEPCTPSSADRLVAINEILEKKKKKKFEVRALEAHERLSTVIDKYTVKKKDARLLRYVKPCLTDDNVRRELLKKARGSGKKLIDRVANVIYTRTYCRYSWYGQIPLWRGVRVIN